MNDEQERKKIDDAVRHRLLADPALDPSKVEAMVDLACASLRLAVLPGRSGYHVRPSDIARFIEDVARRPGFRKDGGRTVNSDAMTFSESEFNRLSPMERLRLINSGGVTVSSDGRVTRFQRA